MFYYISAGDFRLCLHELIEAYLITFSRASVINSYVTSYNFVDREHALGTLSILEVACILLNIHAVCSEDVFLIVMYFHELKKM